MKYVKKPIPVEAIQIPALGESFPESFLDWLKTHDPSHKVMLTAAYSDGEMTYEIQTLEGVMEASTGDYLIKGGDGEFWFNKKAIFEERYEPYDEYPDIQGEDN